MWQSTLLLGGQASLVYTLSSWITLTIYRNPVAKNKRSFNLKIVHLLLPLFQGQIFMWKKMLNHVGIALGKWLSTFLLL